MVDSYADEAEADRPGPALKVSELSTGSIDPLLLGIKAAAQYVGVGRSTIFKAIKDGELERVKIGARSLVPVSSLRHWVKS